MQKIIRIKNREDEYMECIICGNSSNVKVLSLGTRRNNMEDTISLKICKTCLCGLRKVIDDENCQNHIKERD